MAKTEMTFDYIVIGTGPAGAVIAKTLTDDKRTSVLVLEAGGNHDQDPAIRDSTEAPELEEHYFPQYFWQGEGVPQPGVDDRTFEWTTGRLLGGGSSINGEQYVRPTAAVMRQWERLLGDLWSPERAIKTFKRLERYRGQTTNPSIHGRRGRVHIRQAPEEPTAMAKKLVAAIQRATGFKEILDYNDPATPLGPFTRWQLYQDASGQRESASTAFLSPDIVTPSGRGVDGRKLLVLPRSTALRINFEARRAVGVSFVRDGVAHQARALRKVIISAGINSAQLLLLSGIGPADQLTAADVPVLFENPNVGRRLRNHTLNFAVFATNPNDRPLPRGDANALYTGGAFLPDPTPGASASQRGVQLVGIGSGENLTLAILYLRPKSRGSIRIQSRDPLQIALADEAFLANPADLESVKRIYKTYITRIASRLSAIDPAYRLLSPAPEVLADDERLEAFIKENFAHNHHQQGSLRMAPLRDGGVVDAEGNVYGVQDLVVADASIVPFTVDGNTSAAAYLIGATIAQQLLDG